MRKLLSLLTIALFLTACSGEDGADNQVDPNQTDPNQTDPNQTDPNQTDPNQEDPPELSIPCPDGAFTGPAPVTSRDTGATYFVSVDGDDDNDGSSWGSAFATVQAGVDALEPGDTLTIGPGEYFGNVRREGIGDADNVTTIRAAIPGTVILRGDVPAPAFQPLDGYQFVYVADFDGDTEIQHINELDTFTGIERVPSLAELEFTPGTFFQDRDADKLYLSTSDAAPVDDHHYSLSVVDTHGFYLRDATQVVIDGLAVTGFHTARLIHQSDSTLRTVWGLFIAQGADNQILNSHAYFNARGIGTNSSQDHAGGNLIDNALSRANISSYGIGDTGGITLITPRADRVQNSRSFLNSHYGINIRGGGESGQIEEYRSVMATSLAWGNGAHDIRLKTGTSHVHGTERFVALGSSADSQLDPSHSILGTTSSSHGSDTIVLDREDDLDLHAEFVDPDAFDFRLQGGSRFIGAADDGSDRGAFPFDESVIFVSPDGDDGNDGLSIATPLGTLAAAFDRLDTGHTLYLLPGTYGEAGQQVTANLSGDDDGPITIRAHSSGPAIIAANLQLTDSAHVILEGVVMEGPLFVRDSSQITVDRAYLLSSTRGLSAHNVEGLRVTHSLFTGFDTAGLQATDSADLFLAGNLYDNRTNVAVAVDDEASLLFSDYNSYARDDRAFRVGDGTCALDLSQPTFDRYSRIQAPEFDHSGALPALVNAPAFAAGSLYQRPFGPYREAIPERPLQLLDGPRVHSVSATTANIEWNTNYPASARFHWGPTDEMEHSDRVEANLFASLSLTDLEPDTTYYFQLESLRIPSLVDIIADEVELDSPMITFTTLPEDPEPQTFHVDPDGDDSADGLNWDTAFATIQRAADAVGVGDTVLIGEGTYHERVRIRATGTEDAPILFRAAPGARVLMDGFEMALNQAIVVAYKEHLHFDGFQFRQYAFGPSSTGAWRPWMGSEFNLYQSDHITITRCLSDGRGTSTARTIVSEFVEHLFVQNCVSTNKMSNALYLVDSPYVRVEHSVFARPMIAAFLVRRGDVEAVFEHNIFTDSLRDKAESNIPLFGADGGSAGLAMPNNVYQLRAHPPAERIVLHSHTALTHPAISNPTFADPEFAGSLELADDGITASFWPDRLMHSDVFFDFDTFMATNPEVTALGAGLQPEAFTDGQPN